MKNSAELERLLKELIDVENEMQINQDVIERLNQEIASGEKIVGLKKTILSQIDVMAIRTMPWNDIELTFKRIRNLTRPRLRGKSMRRVKHIKVSSSLSMQVLIYLRINLRLLSTLV